MIKVFHWRIFKGILPSNFGWHVLFECCLRRRLWNCICPNLPVNLTWTLVSLTFGITLCWRKQETDLGIVVRADHGCLTGAAVPKVGNVVVCAIQAGLEVAVFKVWREYITNGDELVLETWSYQDGADRDLLFFASLLGGLRRSAVQCIGHHTHKPGQGFKKGNENEYDANRKLKTFYLPPVVYERLFLVGRRRKIPRDSSKG
ncbi:hypothetical protein PVK06_046485 [Gossypium arboreum]|uniref:Reverse transcriptase zinc-binding domain-containing protein n=1 Tax=Gossypium arboreum TaxID=29729 RepID=A0ABR0MAR4_GOSAR|nr:hypothetical protein PVK06_046485 [Gossypium arboreum]